MIYSANAKGPYKVEGVIGPTDQKYVGIIYKPPTWIPSTIYYKWAEHVQDIVIPTSFSGYYHKIVSPGVSGPTEPVWATSPYGNTIDGTILWEAVAYNLMPSSETIVTSTWVVEGALPNRVNATTYAVTNTCQAVASTAQFVCIVAGKSGTGEPAWNTSIGGLTVDGSVTWQYTGSLAVLSTQSNTIGTTQCLISQPPIVYDNFTITNTVTKSNNEVTNASLYFRVGIR